MYFINTSYYKKTNLSMKRFLMNLTIVYVLFNLMEDSIWENMIFLHILLTQYLFCKRMEIFGLAWLQSLRCYQYALQVLLCRFLISDLCFRIHCLSKILILPKKKIVASFTNKNINNMFVRKSQETWFLCALETDSPLVSLNEND